MGRPAVLLPALLAAGPCLATCGSAPQPGQGTSVVLIVVDTLRADHVLDPEGRVATPNLDALAADGIGFERAYAHTSWTLPSHAALFSSRPPHETGVTLNSQVVPGDLPLLADWLLARGYRTRAVHSLISLLPVQPGRGLDRGFERFEDRMQMGLARAPEVTAQVRPVIAELAETGGPFFLFLHYSDPHEPYHAYGTAGVAGELSLNGEVIARLENVAEPRALEARATLRPGENVLRFDCATTFVPRVARVLDGERDLAVEAFVDPSGRPAGRVVHDGDAELEVDVVFYGHEVPEPDEARRRYVLEIEHLDRWLGTVIGELKDRGLYEDALVILTADHGEGLGEHGLMSHGLNVFDELLHVPLVIKPPAGHPSREALARRRGELVRHIDVVPTVLALLDLPALPGQEGTPLQQAAERTLEAEMHYPLEPSQYAVFDGRFKLVHSPEGSRTVLFDLAQDPDELTDLYGTEGSRFGAWLIRAGAMAERLAETDVGLPPDLPPDVAAQLEAMGYTGGR